MQPPRNRQGHRRRSSHRRGAPPSHRSPFDGAPPPRTRAGSVAHDLDREFDNARRSRRRGMILGVTLLVLLAAVAAGVLVVWRPVSGSPSAEPTPGPVATGGRADAEPSDPPIVRPKVTPYIPARGTGRFTRPAANGNRTYGRGKLMRYMIEVEGGLRQDPAAFARSVDAILADRRGWTAGGRWAFRRVDSGPYDFVVKLASPGTVDRICGAYGLETEGKVNCSGGKQVVVNLRRWLLLTTYYKGRPDDYHALTINHEVGHRLGYGHMTCAGRGRPAPVMQQQIFGLKGCVINGWPYDRRGRFVSGPSVP